MKTFFIILFINQTFASHSLDKLLTDVDECVIQCNICSLEDSKNCKIDLNNKEQTACMEKCLCKKQQLDSCKNKETGQ